VLVCRSGQRASQAQELLQRAGLDGGSVLENGISDWEGQGDDVNRLASGSNDNGAVSR
jgi:rhodanese-related sulfurtransferase